MTERRLLAVLGFLFALIGGVLALVGALNLPRNANIDLQFVLEKLVGVILGIAAILGGLFIYKGRMSTGGLLTIVIGVLILILVDRGIGLDGILVIIGGILGILGAEARSDR